MAEIVNVRIDERLVHGQVAGLWVNALKVSRIMVIDDDAANNKLQIMGLKMAVPQGIKLSVLPVQVAARKLSDKDNYPNERIMIIFRNPETLLRALEDGCSLSSVNVGNMSAKDGTRRIYSYISVTPHEEEIFHQMAEKSGISFFTQLTPNDDKKAFIPLLDHH